MLFRNCIAILMLAFAYGIPIEVVYTGDNCDCPKNLNYMVHAPPPPPENPYTPGEYGYKVDVPPKSKPEVTYTFDVTVQQPKPLPPIEDEKWNLYAKVDRVTAPKKDCLANEYPSSKPCSCNTCRTSPSGGSYNRYVSEQQPKNTIRKTCCCNKRNCQCNRRQQTPVNIIVGPPSFKQIPVDHQIYENTKRYRRDLERIFFRKRAEKRSGRYIKQYNKSLKSAPTNAVGLFGDDLVLPQTQPINLFKNVKQLFPVAATAEKSNSNVEVPPTRPEFDFKFPTLAAGNPFKNLKKFSLFPSQSRNKRDIKGEYDLLEKERQQLDLTLPEIIQYMPETLDPNFKKGQCQFGCNAPLQEHNLVDIKELSPDEQQRQLEEIQKEIARNVAAEEKPQSESVAKETLDTIAQTEDATAAKQKENVNKEPKNEIDSTTPAKRNAGNYNGYISNSQGSYQPAYKVQGSGYGISTAAPPTVHRSSQGSTTQTDYGSMPYTFVNQQPYKIVQPSPYAQQSGYIVSTAPGYLAQPTPPAPGYTLPAGYATPQATAPPAAALPTATGYALPSAAAEYSAPSAHPASAAPPQNNYDSSVLGAPSYYQGNYDYTPQLDSIIADIINRHSDFIDAGTHGSGQLVEPSKVQKEETKSFVKMLLDGNWDKLFEDDPHRGNSYIPAPAPSGQIRY